MIPEDFNFKPTEKLLSLRLTDLFTKGEWDLSNVKLDAAFGKQQKQITYIGCLRSYITKLFQDRVNFPYFPKQNPPLDPYTFEEVENCSKNQKRVAKTTEWPLNLSNNKK